MYSEADRDRHLLAHDPAIAGAVQEVMNRFGAQGLRELIVAAEQVLPVADDAAARLHELGVLDESATVPTG